MDEKLLYTIFTIVYSTISAREGNLILISIGGDIETIRAAVTAKNVA